MNIAPTLGKIIVFILFIVLLCLYESEKKRKSLCLHVLVNWRVKARIRVILCLSATERLCVYICDCELCDGKSIYIYIYV